MKAHANAGYAAADRLLVTLEAETDEEHALLRVLRNAHKSGRLKLMAAAQVTGDGEDRTVLDIQEYPRIR
jgi:hypothetical protein